jgi:hypothetical protein
MPIPQVEALKLEDTNAQKVAVDKLVNDIEKSSNNSKIQTSAEAKALSDKLMKVHGECMKTIAACRQTAALQDVATAAPDMDGFLDNFKPYKDAFLALGNLVTAQVKMKLIDVPPLSEVNKATTPADSYQAIAQLHEQVTDLKEASKKYFQILHKQSKPLIEAARIQLDKAKARDAAAVAPAVQPIASSTPTPQRQVIPQSDRAGAQQKR